MRKIAALLGVALLAPAFAFVSGAGVANAACDLEDGTIPNTPGRTVFVGSGNQGIYIDDRDFFDLDDDGKAQGFWVYRESNNRANLQRGGDQAVFVVLAANGVGNSVPFIAPIPLLPPNPGGLPIFPEGATLFPDGFGGGSLAEATGFHDPCTQSSTNPDQILF